MWLIVSKILGYVLSPLPFSLGLIIFSVFLSGFGAKRASSFFRLFGFCLLLFCSLPVVERNFRQGLENQYPPVSIDDTVNADLIVVLGGAIAMPSPPRLEVELHESSDRVLHAFRLYKAGKAPTIFLSAGNIVEEAGMESEAYYIASLLQEWGVPSSALVSAGGSRTTRENALETLEFLDARGLTDSLILLVTSSTHMPRALASFRAVGINAVPSTTDVSAGPSIFPGVFDFLPSIGALKGLTSIWHEYLGTWMYRSRGWI
jgi:uncharacterized SAM-binding protein YcdF (DUF218 family)